MLNLHPHTLYLKIEKQKEKIKKNRVIETVKRITKKIKYLSVITYVGRKVKLNEVKDKRKKRKRESHVKKYS